MQIFVLRYCYMIILHLSRMASLDNLVQITSSPTNLLSAPIWMTSHQLYNNLQFASSLILIDVRSSDEFNYQTIRTAVNIDWIGAAELHNTEPYMRLDMCTKQSSRFSLRKYFNIFLFDNCDYSQIPNSARALHPAWQLINILKQEAKSKAPIYLLTEGFSKFRDTYPYLVRGHPQFTTSILPTEIIEGKLYLGKLITCT